MTSELMITGVLLGGFLSLIFIGYLFLTFSEKHHQRTVSQPQKFAGVFSLALGFIMLGFWTYFMITGRVSLMNSFWLLVTHVALELLSALTLIVAGIGALRGWSRGPVLLMISVGILLFTTMVSLIAYGAMGHPFMMNGVTIVVLIVFAYFIGLVYAWKHFVLRLDETDKPVIK